MSDGELDEGTVWEAARIAARHKLDNLVAIIDKNGWQAMGKTEDVNGGNPKDAFKGHGWHAIDLNGHDHFEIEHFINKEYMKPTALIAETVKGKGVSFMENHLLYHYKHVNDEDYEKAKLELEDE